MHYPGEKPTDTEFEGLILAESRQRHIGPLQEMQSLNFHDINEMISNFTIDVYIVYLMNSMKS